jgi:signal transduction histidine kinase/CheY-like chemotaxis protein
MSKERLAIALDIEPGKTTTEELIGRIKPMVLHYEPKSYFEDLDDFTKPFTWGELTIRAERHGIRTFTTIRQEININKSFVGYTIIFTDVSTYRSMIKEIDQQKESLRELKNIAESASEAKTNFLANMSHEMRTPLNAIIGFSELELGKENEAPSGETHENIEKIYSSGISLLGLINDILDISKIESGKFELVPVEYDMPSLINDTMVLNIGRIGSKAITFHLEIKENLPSKLFGDELRLKQILNNLLSNAFKYTERGDVTLAINCEDPVDETIWMNFTVADTGKGIKAEDIGKLFSDYSQVDVKSNRRIEGTGLGLSITRRLIEMMGGEIGVKSAYGEGSVFSARIPQGFVNTTPIGHEVAGNLKSFKYAMGRHERNKKLVRAYIPYAKVLVVDDVNTNLDVARGLLKRYGITVDCVSSGQDAIDRIRSGDPKYNAIFMDHMMPGMDGIEAVRIIRNEIDGDYAGAVPIIALTANAIIGNEEMFLNNGFQAFLTKPIDIIKLNEVVNRWVRDKEYEKELRQTQGLPETAPGGLDMRNAEEKAKNIKIKTFLMENPIDGVDTQKALERFGGGKDWLEAVGSYIKNTPAMLEDLKNISAGEISEENLDKYRIIVHGIKGASRSISADAAGALAEKLEKAARERDAELLRNETSSFIDLAAKLIGKFTELIKKQDASFSKPGMPAPDPEIIQKIYEAAASYNMQALDKALEMLEQYSYDSGGELVSWLREQADFSEFDSISEKLKKG